MAGWILCLLSESGRGETLLTNHFTSLASVLILVTTRSKIVWPFEWPLPCKSTRDTSEVGIMPLDGQVLVIAFFAVASKLYLWFSELDAVGVDVEKDGKDVLHLDDSGLGLRVEERPDGIVATSLRPRLEGDRYV